MTIETPTPDASSRPKCLPPRAWKAKTWLKLGAMVAIAGFVVWDVMGWMYTDKHYSTAMDKPVLSVARGASVTKVLENVQALGYSLPPTWVKFNAAVYAPAGTLKSVQLGRYPLPQSMTMEELFAILKKGPIADLEVRIPDGAPWWEVKAILQASPDLQQDWTDQSPEALAQAWNVEGGTIEGWLAPDTYYYAPDTKATTLLKTMIKTQSQRLKELWQEPVGPIKTPYEALVLASVIEKETGHPEDRKLVSSVFHNRLLAHMPLQSDPTVIYGLGPSFSGSLTKAHLKSPTPYNTYVIAALPPHPIGSPSLASLEAALHPESSGFYYFVAKGEGRSEFTTNLQQHNRAVDQYLRKATKY